MADDQLNLMDFYDFWYPDVQRLDVRPKSYGVEQRQEAMKLAERRNIGVVMEVGGFTTTFYADPRVPFGKIAVYVMKDRMLRTPVFDRVLDSPEEHWSPFDD